VDEMMEVAMEEVVTEEAVTEEVEGEEGLEEVVGLEAVEAAGAVVVEAEEDMDDTEKAGYTPSCGVC